MKKLVYLLAVGALVVSTTGCQTTGTERTAGLGALTGAAVGALANDDDREKGAAVGALIGGAGGYAYGKHQQNQQGQVHCSQETMQCPDGSFVGRVPPNCHFAPCR